MKEFEDEPSDKIYGPESNLKGKWQRPYLDDEPSSKGKPIMKGHTRSGLAHGVGFINRRSSQRYYGTFVNGEIHGFGRLSFGG